MLTKAPVKVVHVVKGKTETATSRQFNGFETPELRLNDLVWPRGEPGPAFETPLAEIIDLLVETGIRLRTDSGSLLSEALDALARVSTLPFDLLERDFSTLAARFDAAKMRFQVDQELGGADAVDGWRTIQRPDGRKAFVRAYPPRLIHVLAGNAPGVATTSIIRGALTKGVHLLKLPSNDLFTATAVLRTMAALAPDHPVVRSFSAVYWKGGDDAVESALFRAQYFDKLVAWGGEQTIRGAIKYAAPGFELVSFDPKNSISLIGQEAFASEDALNAAAAAAATDATVFNQDACVASRFQFVEGDEADADRFSVALLREMGVERPTASAVGPLPDEALRNEVDGLRDMEPFYRVWGAPDGRGIVIRSEEPVPFHPMFKTVNVVPVKNLADAVRYASVATQTVGVYPGSRKAGLRNDLCAAGVQRIVNLGSALGAMLGLPHDGFLPLSRFVRWVVDED